MCMEKLEKTRECLGLTARLSRFFQILKKKRVNMSRSLEGQSKQKELKSSGLKKLGE